MKPSVRVWVGCAPLLVCWSPTWAQTEPAAYQADDVAFRKATIISEGTRIAAELFTLKENENKKLPTIIMCHGWGGVAERLRRTRSSSHGPVISSSLSTTAAGEPATAGWC